MKTTNIIALSLLLVCSLSLSVNMKSKFKSKFDFCWTPDPNSLKFEDNWKVGRGGEINFQGIGRDLYIRIHASKGTPDHHYWLVLNGWDNTRSRITNSAGADICFPTVTALDLNKKYDYRIRLDGNKNLIQVLIDGSLSFECNVGPWKLGNDNWYSVSRYGGANYSMCNLQTKPLAPGQECREVDPNAYKFDYFANKGIRQTLLQRGSGELNFKGKGRDLYIKLHNQENDGSHQYWIVINGWENTKSRVTRGNGSEVCFIDTPRLDLNAQLDYKVTFDPNAASITVQINDRVHFSCTDRNGWNANNAQFYSFSRYGPAMFQFCDLKIDTAPECWIPDPNSYSFDNQWLLPKGEGEVSFKGIGRDVYIQLNNQNNSSSHQYWIVINGWDNTRSRITRGDGSEVCFPGVAAVDLNKLHDYRIISNPDNAEISVFINGKLSFACIDIRGWNADRVSHYSIARYGGANFKICNQKTKPLSDDLCWTPRHDKYKFSDSWTAKKDESLELNFNGIGRDLYIQLNLQNDSNSHQYWMVINGWDNTRSRVTRGDGSEVCFPAVNAVDLNNPNKYQVIFDNVKSSFTVYINDQLSFTCNDPKGWNVNPLSGNYFYSYSRYSGANFQICGHRHVKKPTTQTWEIVGNILSATTGLKIPSLTDGTVRFVNVATGQSYDANVNAGDSSYKINLPAGEYNLIGKAKDFVEGKFNIKVIGKPNESHDVILNPEVKDESSRIVLTWTKIAPKAPEALDLDLHAINGSERVNYTAKTTKSGNLLLDVDNLVSGPETISIKNIDADIQILVNNFNKKISLIDANAQVDVYKGNNLLKSFKLPAPKPGDENKKGWDLGTYNPKNGTFKDGLGLLQ